MSEPGTPDPTNTGPDTGDGGSDGAALEAADPGRDPIRATSAPNPGLAPAPDVTPAPDYDEHGTPSLGYVRNKIENRFATSLGATELAEDTAPVRDQADQQAERDRKAAERLEEIRRSLG